MTFEARDTPYYGTRLQDAPERNHGTVVVSSLPSPVEYNGTMIYCRRVPYRELNITQSEKIVRILNKELVAETQDENVAKLDSITEKESLENIAMILFA